MSVIYCHAMYNKLFTKILDSSIWLASPEKRIVWITMLAAMDEDGFVQMATVANVARRANVDECDAASAIEYLESPEDGAPDCPFQGRRIERVPGGWMVLKAKEYADIVRRIEMKALNRERVRRYRAGNANVTPRNAGVTASNDSVMQSDTDTDTDTDTGAESVDRFAVFYAAYPRKKAPKKAAAAFKALDVDDVLLATMVAAIERQKQSRQWQDPQFIPFPATWLNQKRWEDVPEAEDRRTVVDRRSAAAAPEYSNWVCDHEPPCLNREWHAMKMKVEQEGSL